MVLISFYSHVNYSVTKIETLGISPEERFYSHVNYSVTKIGNNSNCGACGFYSHVNYSVTKIAAPKPQAPSAFTVT